MEHNPPPPWAWAAGGAVLLWLAKVVRDLVIRIFTNEDTANKEFRDAIRSDIGQISDRLRRVENRLTRIETTLKIEVHNNGR